MAKKGRRIFNNYRCFSMYDYFLIFFVFILVMLPFISIILYQFSADYNTIKWDEFYGEQNYFYKETEYDSENYDYYVEGEFFNANFTDSFEMQECFIETSYDNIPIPRGSDFGDTRNISIADRDYTFVMNGTSDITFVSQYEFEPAKIYTYYPLFFFLPIQLLKGVKQLEMNPITLEFENQIYFVPYSFIFPSDWSAVWDNLELYFYYVNDDNRGIGFSYGNKETVDNTPRITSVPTKYGDLSLSMYDLNISSQESERYYYDELIPSFTLHNNPLPDDSIFGEYLNLLGSARQTVEGGSLFGSTNVSIMGLTVDITDRQGLFYDYRLLEVTQLDGFPSYSDFPIIEASKCGYYIKVHKEFDCTEANNYIDIINELDNMNTYGQLVNGIQINDDALYLGRIIPFTEKITTVLMYDLLIIGCYFAVIFIIGWRFGYVKKYKEFRQQRKIYCDLKYNLN